jgi:LPXTG-motif cell wall-anchored protein
MTLWKRDRTAKDADWVEAGTHNLVAADKVDNDDNEWSYTWENQYTKYEYKVEESNVPTGYTSVSNCMDNELGEETSITFTNTLNWQIVKRSASNGTLKLEGAQFSLEGTETTYTGESKTGGAVEWRDSNSLANVSGDFTLKETKAPAGYMIGADWTVNMENGIPRITSTSSTTVKSELVGNIYTFYYDDEILYSLPSTGGRGIYWYLVSGTLLMMAAVLIIYKNKRREVLEN